MGPFTSSGIWLKLLHKAIGRSNNKTQDKFLKGFIKVWFIESCYKSDVNEAAKQIGAKRDSAVVR